MCVGMEAAAAEIASKPAKRVRSFEYGVHTFLTQHFSNSNAHEFREAFAFFPHRLRLFVFLILTRVLDEQVQEPHLYTRPWQHGLFVLDRSAKRRPIFFFTGMNLLTRNSFVFFFVNKKE